MKQVSESEALHRMAVYCSTAERCIQDVQRKILSAGLSDEVAERIILCLLKEKFIDEKRFAKSYVNDKLRFNKWGRIKIAYELNKKGIPSTYRREALETVEEKAYQDILLTLLKEKRKLTKGKDERDLFNKLLRFAAGRGFESHESILCLKQLFKGNDYAEDMD